MIKKYSLIFLFLLSFTGIGFGQSDIIISQYIETNSGTTPKGIEVFNVSGANIDFSISNLVIYQGTNGGSCNPLVTIASGILSANEVWVIGTTDLVTYANTNGTALSGSTEHSFIFNGDDALEIYLGGVLQDQFGICGIDPGSSWAANGVSTSNQNIEMLNGICDGDLDGWTDPSTRFITVSTNPSSNMSGFGNSPSPCTVSTDEVDWCNLQFPDSGTITFGGAYDVYAQVYEAGLTDSAGQAAGITAWIGYNTSNINPNDASWTWIPAVYNTDSGNNDEYRADIGSVIPTSGTYYYASRFQLNGGPFRYGGYNAGGGGFWDGTTNVNGVLTLTADQVNFCNVDYPKTATITEGDAFTVYAQAYEPGVTDSPGQGANILAWIGYTTLGVNHQPWDDTGWTWIPATYDSDFGNNDQYTAEIGSALADGTYYFASRFQLNGSDYSYGGIQADNLGNFWDATNNNGILFVIPADNICGSESFDNSNATSSYSSNSFVGDNGITWNYVASRDENGDANGSGINGNALMLRRESDNSKVTSSSVAGGIGDFSVKLYKGFTGPGNRQVELLVNGISQGTSTPFDDYNEHVFTVNNINIFGNVIVEIRNITGEQVIVDDIQWTCYHCSTPEDAGNFLASNGCGGISLNWDLNCAEEVMLVARQGSPVTAVPTGDGSTYTADSIFGSGTELVPGEFNVYEGTGESVTVTGLTSGVTYYFTLFSRIGNSWTAGVTSSATYNATVLNAGTFSSYNRCGDIELTWILPACYEEVLVVARNGNAVTATPSGDGSAYTADAIFGSGTAISGGEYVVYKGDANTATITGLTNGDTYHFEIFIRVGTVWSSGVSTSTTASTSGGSGPTTFNPGDLVFVGFDSYINGPNDKYSILTMVDIGPGTAFIMANLLYEWNDPANVSTGKWYNCGANFDADPPYASIQYSGCSDIPKGSIICVETQGDGSIVSISVNGIAVNSEFSIDTTHFNAGNISTSAPDAMWLMQGTFSAVMTEADGADNGTNADLYRTFDGTVFGGLQTKGYFQSLADDGNVGGQRVSRIHPDIECLYLETGPTSESQFFGFYYGDKTGTQYEILSAITDISANWDIQSGSGISQQYDEVNFTCNDTFTITSNDSVEGQWKGSISTDWFDCRNWQNFTVPDATVNVQVNNLSVNHCVINPSSSVHAAKYNNLAACNDMTLESNTYMLSMPDNTSVLHLYGHWSNSVDESSFNEGNGTVVFTGSGVQTIYYGVPPTPPAFQSEEFYHVILNNDFETSQSNNLHVNGDLTINSSKTLHVNSNDYVFVNQRVTNNGTFYIENSGSLVQLGDGTNTNVGNIIMDRTTQMRALDYVYWSSPVNQFNVNDVFSTSSHIYQWNPTIANANGGQGDWVNATGQSMSVGQGYIIRAPGGYSSSVTPFTATFTGDAVTGKPNNGTLTVPISRGNITASIPGSSTPNGQPIEDFDDNWNLVGNPYPSAINAIDFLTENDNLDGFVYLWRHLTQPDSSVDPFYDNFADGSNYYESDYVAYNSMGSSTPGGFNGYIGAGQSFMVNMLETTPSNNTAGPATENVLFTNAMRNVVNDNSQFFRTSEEPGEKHKIWLNLYSANYDIMNTILVGYASEATMQKDRLFDAVTPADKTKIYSLIDEEFFIIQGRALPFTTDDRIPLGLNVESAGNFYIALADVEGLFEATTQKIYLKDNLLGLTYNLSEAPYEFTSASGQFNDRFELVFRNESLSVNDPVLSNNILSVINLPEGSVKFKVEGQHLISKVEIIDLLGRVLYQLEGSHKEEIYFLPQLNQSAYIAKVTLSNGQILVKKAIKN